MSIEENNIDDIRTEETEVLNEEIPLEYQLFALSFKQEGAISYFKEHLSPSIVGYIHGNTGIGEFYQALLDFYDLTEMDPVDVVAFRSWLETDSNIYNALGGASGLSMFIDMIMAVELSSPEAVVPVLTSKANKRKQLDLAQELKSLISKKDHKSEEDRSRLAAVAEQIRDLEHSLNANPLSSVTTAIDIAGRADSLTNMPDFLMTPYKSLNKAMGYTEDGGFFRGAVHAIIASSGRGKPLDIDTRVLMGNGTYVRLGDIAVGDTVIGHSGKPRKVLRVYEQGHLSSLEIVTRSGRRIRSAYDHSFLRGDQNFVQAQDLAVGDSLVLRTSMNFVNQHSNPNLARVAGYMLGDGAISSGNQNLTCFDKGVLRSAEHAFGSLGYRLRHVNRGRYDVIVDKFGYYNQIDGLNSHLVSLLYAMHKTQTDSIDILARYLDKTYNCISQYMKPLRDFYGVTGNSELIPIADSYSWNEQGVLKNVEPITRILKKIGISGTSKTKLVSDYIMSMDNQSVAEFLAAYFECDGHITNPNRKKKGRGGQQTPAIEYYSVNKEILRSVQSLLVRFGIRSRLSVKKGKYQDKTHISYRLKIGDTISVGRFCSNIPVTGQKAERILKWNVFDDSVSQFDLDKIVSIEALDPVECRCIEVEVDHTFLAEDFIVHNSTLAKCLVNHWLDEGYRALYINFEEAQSHWETILMTQVIKENVYAKADNWSGSERDKKIQEFKDHMMEWGDRLMVRHDPDTSYFEDLEKWLRDIMGHNDNVPDVVVIDTIQSMLGRGGGPRWEHYESMMIRLEKLAREMNAAFIITGQQNTEAMKEKRDVIRQSDTGGSIAIVQKSSVVIFITEKKLLSGDDSEDDSIMQLQIPKNRITGSMYMYDPPIVRYNDATKSYEEFEVLDSELYDTDYVPESEFAIREFE